jgi:mannose-6-phosphate isomerase class I
LSGPGRPAPALLRPDNFTPPTRTPWGGRKIRSAYKAGLLTGTDTAIVGESWEISVEPSFPSRTVATGATLQEVIAAAPVDWLGDAVAAAYGGQTPLLVKLLDTADNLSVQVHPAMDDAALAPDESGKPESWIVLEAQAGAGIYMGLRDGVTRADVERCLTTRGPMDELLNFVPCVPGDAFVIGAGTVHAIGAGMTLLEPQHVAPGKRGLTYRFWDWNRLYDAKGRQTPDGNPRELHVQRSLAVSNFGATGPEFVASCRALPVPITTGPVTHSGLLRCPYFEAESLAGTGAVTVDLAGTMMGVTAVDGHVEIHGQAAPLRVPRGQSAVIPAVLGTVELRVDGHCILTRSLA